MDQVEGLEDQGVAIEPPTASTAIDAAAAIRNGDDWMTSLGTAELAAGCAQLAIQLNAESEALDAVARRLDEAKKALAERFATQGIDQVRTDTSEGRRLVHLASVYRVSVPAAARESVREWLRANVPAEELATFVEKFDAQHFQAFVKRAEAEASGEFPADLVADGKVSIYRGSEIRFRKS